MQHLTEVTSRVGRRSIADRMLAATAVVLLVSAQGCASSKTASPPSAILGGGSAGTQQITNPDIVSSGVTLNMANLAISSKTEHSIGMNEAWSRLTAAYAALSINNLTVRDEKQHLIGNSSFRARRKVGDVELRFALDCGGNTSAPNAESYDVTMGIRSQLVVLSPDKVQLETFVDGVARNALTNNSTVVKCITQGLFEKKIAEMVRTGVVPAPKK